MEINIRTLIAINKCAASKEDERYYLNGVFVQPDSAGNIIFSATDGHKMVAWRIDAPESHCIPEDGFIIPRKLLERIKLTKRENDHAEMNFSDGFITISHETAGEYTDKSVDGTFPDWRRFVPSGHGEIAPAKFNGKFLAELDALAKSVSKQSFASIRQEGENPALVSFGDDDIFGVIMPMRDVGAVYRPEWVSAVSETQESIAA